MICHEINIFVFNLCVSEVKKNRTSRRYEWIWWAKFSMTGSEHLEQLLQLRLLQKFLIRAGSQVVSMLFLSSFLNLTSNNAARVNVIRVVLFVYCMQAFSKVKASANLPLCCKLKKSYRQAQKKDLVNCRCYIRGLPHMEMWSSSSVSRGERANEEGSRHVCHAERDGRACTGFHCSPDTQCI